VRKRMKCKTRHSLHCCLLKFLIILHPFSVSWKGFYYIRSFSVKSIQRNCCCYRNLSI
jgi:hypothetical protein